MISPTRLFWLLVFAVLVFACATEEGRATAEDAAAGTTVIYLTRHAEKAAGDDPELLPAGTRRAEALARRLGRRLDAVYATDFRRTQATARPSAAAAGVRILSYSATGTQAFADHLLNDHAGQTVLVVGHSNTIPDLVNALVGERRFGDIDDKDYDKLYEVRSRNGQVSVRQIGH